MEHIIHCSRTPEGIEKEDEEIEETRHRIAIEISRENVAHVAENKILKEQNKIDEHARNEYAKKISDRDLAKEKNYETEKWNRQVEYRQCLLKQIEDKEKLKKGKHSPEIRGNAYTYSEDLMTPEVKKNLKLTKQQEMRDALDECVRMKNALKLENKRKELDEDRSRFEFLKKRDEDELMVREKAKQRIEIKEQRKEEAVRQWNTNKDDEREQFIDSLMRKDTTLSQLNNDIAEAGKEVQFGPEEEPEGSEESKEDENEIGEELKENEGENGEESKENEVAVGEKSEEYATNEVSHWHWQD